MYTGIQRGVSISALLPFHPVGPPSARLLAARTLRGGSCQLWFGAGKAFGVEAHRAEHPQDFASGGKPRRPGALRQ